MRIMELFEALTADKQEAVHKDTLDKTGFWGAQGAGCVFVSRSTGRFLLAHRGPEVQEPNQWGSWGGAIDEGENPVEAVKREVHEETGYTGPVTIEPMYVFKSNSFRYSNFLVVVDEEFKPKLDWENQGFRWCEFGVWPAPLHFGILALLKDQASVETMRAYTK